MITLPVSSSVYQSMVANIQQIHTNSDGTLCITPMQVQKPGSYGHSNSNTIHQSNANGQHQLNNNTNTNNANLMQLCRALNSNFHYNNSPSNNGHLNSINFSGLPNNIVQIKTEKETKYKRSESPTPCLATTAKTTM